MPARQALARVLPRIGAAFYVVVAVSALVFACQHPFKNWDMYAYIGAMLRLEESDTAKWYERTLEEVKRSAPEHLEYVQQHWLSSNSEAFRQQMPFYLIKPLYYGAMGALSFGGIPLGTASHIISVLAAAGTALLLFVRPPPGAPAGTWWLLTATVLFFMPYSLTELAQLSTPDALGLCMLLLAFYAQVIWRKMNLLLIFSLLALLARPDMLPLLLMLLMVEAYYGSTHKKMLLAMAVILIAVNLLVLHLAGYYGWHVHFEYQFIQKIAYPATLKGDVTPEAYTHEVKYTLSQAIKSLVLPVMGLWSAVALVKGRRLAKTDMIYGCLIVALIYFMIKILVFPQWDQRHFYPCYLLCYICGFLVLAKTMNRAHHDG